MTNIDRVYQKYIERRFPLPSEKAVATLEHRLRIELPADYRRFLLRYNGGYFGDHSVYLPAGVPGDSLVSLYGIGTGTEDAELGKSSDLSLFNDNDPPTLLIIGSTGLGYLVALDLNPETTGDLYWKTYARSVFDQDNQWFLLGDSLEGFFAMIGEPRQ